MIVNQETLDINEYGENKIKREAKYFETTTNSQESTRANIKVVKSVLEDETDLWQFGGGDENTFYEVSDIVQSKS